MADEKFFVEEKNGESWGVTIDTVKTDGSGVAASDERTGVKNVVQSLDYEKDYLGEVERKSNLRDTSAKYSNKSQISHELVNQLISEEAATRLGADLTIIGKNKDGCELSNDNMEFNGVQGFVEFPYAETTEPVTTPTMKGLYLEVVRLQNLCNTLVKIINTEIFGNDTIKITEKGLSYEATHSLECLVKNNGTVETVNAASLKEYVDNKSKQLASKVEGLKDTVNSSVFGDTTITPVDEFDYTASVRDKVYDDGSHEATSSVLDYVDSMDNYYKYRVAGDADGTSRGSTIWEDESE